MADSLSFREEGLRELGQALKEVDAGLLNSLRINMKVAGDVVRDEAKVLFTGGVARSKSVQKTAEGFESRVRLGGASEALLVVAQSLRKTTGDHPEWGAKQMVKGLIPAEEVKRGEVDEILEEGVIDLLHRHGF